MKKIILKILLTGISGYQYALSPFLPRSCCFRTSCSEYAKIVLSRFGVARGLLLITVRIIRCQGMF